MKKVFWILMMSCALSCSALFAAASPACAVAAPDTEEQVFSPSDIDVMPEFPGGQQALYNWLGSHIKYPKSAAKDGAGGRVVVEFVISKTGSIEDVSVVKSVHPALDDEAMRVIRSMPKWTPGRVNDRPVKVAFRLPLSFNVDKK